MAAAAIASVAVRGTIAAIQSKEVRNIAIKGLSWLGDQLTKTGNKDSDPLPGSQRDEIKAARPMIQAALQSMASPYTFDLSDSAIMALTKGAWRDKVTEVRDAMADAQSRAEVALAKPDSPDYQILQSSAAMAAANWPGMFRQLRVSYKEPGRTGQDGDRRLYAGNATRSKTAKLTDALMMMEQKPTFRPFNFTGKATRTIGAANYVGAASFGDAIGADITDSCTPDGAFVHGAGSPERAALQATATEAWSKLESYRGPLTGIGLNLGGGIAVTETGGNLIRDDGTTIEKSSVESVWAGAMNLAIGEDEYVVEAGYQVVFPEVEFMTQSAVTSNNMTLQVSSGMTWAVDPGVGNSDGLPIPVKCSGKDVPCVALMVKVSGVRQDKLKDALGRGGSTAVEVVGISRFGLQEDAVTQGRAPLAADTRRSVLNLEVHRYGGAVEMQGSVNASDSLMAIVFPAPNARDAQNKPGMYYTGGAGRIGPLMPAFNSTCYTAFTARDNQNDSPFSTFVQWRNANGNDAHARSQIVQRLRSIDSGSDISGSPVPYMSKVVRNGIESQVWATMTQPLYTYTSENASLTGAAEDAENDVRIPIGWTLGQYLEVIAPSATTWAQLASAANRLNIFDFSVPDTFQAYVMMPAPAGGRSKKDINKILLNFVQSSSAWLVEA